METGQKILGGRRTKMQRFKRLIICRKEPAAWVDRSIMYIRM